MSKIPEFMRNPVTIGLAVVASLGGLAAANTYAYGAVHDGRENTYEHKGYFEGGVYKVPTEQVEFVCVGPNKDQLEKNDLVPLGDEIDSETLPTDTSRYGYSAACADDGELTPEDGPFMITPKNRFGFLGSVVNSVTSQF